MSRRPRSSRRVGGEAGKPADPPRVGAVTHPESSDEPETRYAVFKNVGPGTYRGVLVEGNVRPLLPVCGEISFPPEQHDLCRSEGLEFVRWAS